jgi:hypothetical protein
MNAKQLPKFLTECEKSLETELRRIRSRIFDMTEDEYAIAAARMEEIKTQLRPSWNARAAYHDSRRLESMGY